MNYLSKNNNECLPLQSKLFTRWVSSQLKGYPQTKIQDITKDFSNGVAFIELAEALTHKKAPHNWKHSPNIDTEKIENCNLAIDMFQKDGIKLNGISGKDVSENNQKVIFKLIWTLILNYLIGNCVSESTTNKNDKNNSKMNKIVNGKFQNETHAFENQENALLSWAQNRIQNYSNIESFKPYDLAICALLDSYCPDKINFKSLKSEDSQNNLKLANDVMGQLGIQVFVYQEDISQNGNNVDRMTLLTQLAAIKSVIDKGDQKVASKINDEKESESEWDPETSSQIEQISENEANLEKKELLEEAKIIKEQDEKRKALADARQKRKEARKLRKQLILLKAREEAKLREEVAKVRSQEVSDSKDNNKQIKASKANDDRVNRNNVPDKRDSIDSNNDKNRNDKIQESKDIVQNGQKTDENDVKTDDSKSNDFKIITKKHIKIRISYNPSNTDINSLAEQIKKIKLNVSLNDNNSGYANEIITHGDATITIPESKENAEMIAQNMNISVSKDGKIVNSNAPAVLTSDDGAKQTYHVNLL